MFFNIFKKKNQSQNRSNGRKYVEKSKQTNTSIATDREKKEQVAIRKGEIGEYKIDIQLSQFPKEYKYLTDIMVKNPKSSTGFSQIDHILITSYGIFVIETKNYQGTIYGGKNRKEWNINGKFKIMNPFYQNFGHIKVIQSLLENKLNEHFISIVSFTKRCKFKVELDLRKIQSDELIVYDIELSEFINRKININKIKNNGLPLLSSDEIEKVYSSILSANITDQNLREQHVSSIKKTKKEQDKKVDKQDSQKCVICHKAVSEKVAAYCHSNKKFEGKVYCYQHQFK